LNDVSLNNYDKYDELTGKWIGESFKKLCDCINLFIDEKEIQNAQLIIESSVEAQRYSESEKLLWRKQLRERLSSWGFGPQLKRRDSTSSESSTSSFRSSFSEVEVKHSNSNPLDPVAKFFSLISSPKWKLREERKDVKHWTKKEKLVGFFNNKYEFTINVPLEEAAYKFLIAMFDPEVNPMSQTEYYSSGEGSSITTYFFVYSVYKMGGIFVDRDFILLYKFFRVSEDTIVIICENSEAIPANDKYIRLTFYTNSYCFKALSPTSTQITRIFQADPNGSIPKWFINSLCGRIIDLSLRVIQVLETGKYNKTVQLKPLP